MAKLTPVPLGMALSRIAEALLPRKPGLVARSKRRIRKEIALYRRRTAALRAEITQLRREAGKNGRDAARWREKAEAWRREAVRLTRSQNRTALKRAVSKVRNLAFPAD